MTRIHGPGPQRGTDIPDRKPWRRVQTSVHQTCGLSVQRPRIGRLTMEPMGRDPVEPLAARFARLVGPAWAVAAFVACPVRADASRLRSRPTPCRETHSFRKRGDAFVVMAGFRTKWRDAPQHLALLLHRRYHSAVCVVVNKCGSTQRVTRCIQTARHLFYERGETCRVACCLVCCPASGLGPVIVLIDKRIGWFRRIGRQGDRVVGTRPVAELLHHPIDRRRISMVNAQGLACYMVDATAVHIQFQAPFTHTGWQLTTEYVEAFHVVPRAVFFRLNSSLHYRQCE
ncbi:hypothetical protein FB390_4967 [Nocardia bhagyanarayanae]|uniref:Uncharacterized protein n=1 Tax=Nocardia bhagyanarayanae TaxID=1215925 RepID=A0A543FHA6_9NOCA|nr:hypothetical protein FB390_4967 [Nocardia bhagyanarayanae]